MARTPHAPDDAFLRLVPSGELYLKTRRTRDRFLRQLIGNLRRALAEEGIDAGVRRSGHHELRLVAPDLSKAAGVAQRTFGVNRIERVSPVRFDSLEGLSSQVAAMTRHRVVDRSFAVRVRRRGGHDWSSKDVEAEVGRLLLPHSDGVDLDAPDATVRLHIQEELALVVEESWPGPDGLPLSTQQRVLVLFSGGIDSPVAAWMMMRRGCPVDYLHLKLDCSVSDHALVVADELTRRWGHGSESRFHVVDFQPVKDQLRRRVSPGFRQVMLKQLMLAAGAEVARRGGVELMVTGDSLGQVSSQTAAHLAEIDRYVSFPVLRPLVGFTKEEIVARARDVGTYDLSIRGREVCDLSDGEPVETHASARRLEYAHRRLDDSLVETALSAWEWVEASAWTPGAPLQPAGSGAAAP